MEQVKIEVKNIEIAANKFGLITNELAATGFTIIKTINNVSIGSVSASLDGNVITFRHNARTARMLREIITKVFTGTEIYMIYNGHRQYYASYNK